MTTRTLFALTLSLTVVAACGAQPPQIEERQGQAIADNNYMQTVMIDAREFPFQNIHLVDSGSDFSQGLLSVDGTYQRLFWHAYQTPQSDHPYNWIIASNWPYYPDVPSELAGDLASGFASVQHDGSLYALQGARPVIAGTCNGVQDIEPSFYYFTGGVVNFHNGAQMALVWHSEPGYSVPSPCGPHLVSPEYHYEWIVRARNATKYPDTLVPDCCSGGTYPAFTLQANGTVYPDGNYACPQKVIRSPVKQVKFPNLGWNGGVDGTRFCIAPLGAGGYPNAYMLVSSPSGNIWLRVPETLRHPRWSDLSSANAFMHLEPFWQEGQGQDTDDFVINGNGVMAVGDPQERANPWHIYELDFELNADGTIKYYGWMTDDSTMNGHFWDTVTAGAGGP
jgi:hypothetical protein